MPIRLLSRRQALRRSPRARWQAGGRGAPLIPGGRASDLAPLATVDGEVVVAVASAVGKARLIDNVTMQIAGAEVSTDLGVIPIAEQESTS